MDIVTHALLGALVAQSVSPARHQRLVVVPGAGVALLPDLDVFIQSSSDPLLVLEYHRHFTHSLLFAPLAALAVTFLLAPWLRQSMSKLRIFSLALLAYASACLLDACTSYGTYLLWPLLNEPFALGIIAVVDPLFSLMLLVCLVLTWRGYRSGFARLGLLMGLGYLLLGWGQQQRALSLAETLDNDGQTLVLREAKPTLGNIVLWRVMRVTESGDLHLDAYHLSWRTRHYPGETRALLVAEDLDLPKDSRALQQLRRYQDLNSPLLVSHSQDAWFIGDGRYSLLPTRADPLWGLQINPRQPDAITAFGTRRQMTAAQRQAFVDMLLGRSEVSEN